MDETLHPAQIEAVEKLKRLKVGALYIDRQDGKLRTIAELIHYRMGTNRIDGVIWLCTSRKKEMLLAGIHRYLSDKEDDITLCGGVIL